MGDTLISWLTGPRVILAIVWSGCAALTVALVILMRTRWGQQKPLRKCIVLSLIAHLLFVVYAMTVHVVMAQPGLGYGPTIRVASIADVDTIGEPSKGTGDAPPWEAPAAEPAVPDMPDFSINPPKAPPMIDGSRPSVTAPPPDIQPPAGPATVPDHPREEPAAPFDVDLPRTAAAPAPIDAPAPPQHEQPPSPMPIGPQPVELAPRIDTVVKPVMPDDLPAADLTELLGKSPSLPALPDEPMVADPAGPIADEPPSPIEVPPRTGPANANTALVPIRPRDATSAAGSGGGPATADAIGTPEVYSSRLQADRIGLVERQGGSAETEAAVQAALEWFVKHQSPDGHWDARQFGAGRETRTLDRDRGGAGAQADTGLTGLALLAFLGAGHTHERGEQAETVKRGLNYLLASQAPDGNLAGRAEVYAFMYCHGMATLALCEAYAMTHDTRLERPVRKAIAYTVAAQNLASGGWRYKPNERGDTSQLGWQLMALKSGEMAGIAMPERTRQGMVRFLNSVSSGANGGLASYRPDEKTTRPMTAEALVCREFLDLPLGATAAEASTYLLDDLPGQGPPNFYYWYYGTLGMFQLQGDSWRKWNEAVSTALTRSQRKTGDATGSWDPDGVWGGYGGRVFSTALGALCLEVYYRYLPLYSVAAGRALGPK
ncbi:MAG: hypothetical protein HYX69_20465 [Planctomycetia bacterium]|nr:hypothetical protein [Planctomycetia bacterium]